MAAVKPFLVAFYSGGFTASQGRNFLRLFLKLAAEHGYEDHLVLDHASEMESPQPQDFAEYGQRVLFKPEASPLGPCISALRAATQEQADIFEGSGGVLLIDSFRRGITGTIPGVELLDGTTALWNALKAGDEERAYRLYWPICALITLQLQGGMDGFIVSERYIMHKRGLFPNQVHRGPLSFSLDDAMRDEIDRLMGHLERAIQG